jgi:pectinesterase
MVENLPPDSFSSTMNRAYCEVNGRALYLDVFTPVRRSGTKRTAVIFLHGGGWRTGNRSMHHPLAQRLASRGYVCFTPEYRLSVEALYPAAVFDIKAAIRWVRHHSEEFNIDPARIALAGHSAGGELAAFAGATNGKPQFEGDYCHSEISSRVNAVINMDGILAFIHPESGEGDDSKRVSAATYWFGFSKTENPGRWTEASPLTHAGEQAPPILFLNSAVERMHAGRSDYIKVLSRYNIYSEIRTFENAPHSFCLFHPWFDPTVRYIDEFLRKVLK